MDLHSTQQIELPAQPFRFTGNGGEYFRIWIVNLLLTILTLGIYSAWAKVRRLKYFYGNTEVAGARFDYHGEPLAILKGRLIALGLFLLYNASTSIFSIWSVVGLVFLALLLPWLLRNSFRFRMRNSSYRGLRFGFHGSLGGAYRTFLLYPFLMIATLYILAPLFHARLKQYQHGNARYGATRFSFGATAGDFFRAYGAILLCVVALSVAFFLAGFMAAGAGDSEGPSPGVFIAMFATLMVGMLLITPLWQARMQNLTWNHTQLGAHRFRSSLRFGPLAAITFSNFLLIVLTVGFFTPWAAVRLARYRAESMELLPASDIEEFVADQASEVSATGEEAAEMFDFDIGL